ncbi:MAG: type 4a pilus biogenesis protein PilO [Actinomycetota bacterium]
MRERSRLLIAGASVLVLIILMYLLVIGPKRSELSEAREQVAAKETEVASLEGQLRRLQELQENAGALEAELADIRELVPDQHEIANFMFLVQEASDEAGTDFVQITPELPKTPPEGAPLAEVRMSIGAGGGYFAVQDFLRRLYELDRAVRIDLLSMNGSTGSDGETTLVVELTARIFFELPATGATTTTGTTTAPGATPSPSPTPGATG